MNLLIQMQMLKRMKKLARSGDGSDDDTEGSENSKKDTAFKGVQPLHRRYENRPEKRIDEYVMKLRRELGITNPAQCWQASDFTERIAPQCGKLLGPLRVRYACSEALQEFYNGRPSHMAA